MRGNLAATGSARSGATQRPPSPVVGVGAVCIRDGRLLLVLRRRGAAAGTWALPGGRLEAGEGLADGVARELREETGLRARVGALCGVAERIGAGYHYVILDYWVQEAAGEPVAGDDAADICWASRADLDRLQLAPLLAEFLAEHGVLARLT